MGVVVELKYVKDLGGGKHRFRKPYPPTLRATLGQQLKQTKVIRSEKELLHWWTSLTQIWEKQVTAQRRLETARAGTSKEQWEASLLEASQLLAGVRGLEDDDARAILAEQIVAPYPIDAEDGYPVGVSAKDVNLLKALMQPEATAPEPTLRDALKLYLEEHVKEAKGKRGRGTRGGVERVFEYAFTALKGRADHPLVNLGSSDGRAVRDFMQSRVKTTGEKISPASVRRELNTLSSALGKAIKGFDLDKGDRAKNIFADLSIDGLADDQEGEKRVSLPALIIAQITERLETQKRRKDSALPTLSLVWRILKGTGCRVSEVVGLRAVDVVLTGPHPHILVRWNEDRRLKTKASIRAVPLCGDALTAAKGALKAAGNNAALFPRYGGPEGGTNASAALLKHVNAVAPDPKHVVHSLRHNMADWLRLSRAANRAEKIILGHVRGEIGDRVYGSAPADLELTHEAMLNAHARAEADIVAALAE